MELKLHILLEFNIIIQFLSVIIHCIFPTKTDILCPFCPLYIVKSSFHSHEQCIIWQPPAVLCYEFLIVRILADITVLVCFSQKRITAFVDFFIIYIIKLLSPIYFLTVFFIQNPFFHQCIQINKIRISCKCRKGLIWGISIAGRSQRQNLPISLTGFL